MSEPYECRESSTICHRGPLKHVVMSTIRIARSIHCSQLPEWQLEVSSDLARPGYLGRQTRLGIPPQVRAGSRKVRTDLELLFQELGAVFAPCDSHGGHHQIFQRTPVANRQSFATVVRFRQQDAIPLPCERSCRTISYKCSILM